jgi:hypothetical protein
MKVCTMYMVNQMHIYWHDIHMVNFRPQAEVWVSNWLSNYFFKKLKKIG